MTSKRPSSTHPPLPPTTEDDRVDHLRLLRSRRVGPVTYRRLLAEHGTAQAALAALPDIAKAAGVPNYEVCPEGVVLAELKAGHRTKARLLFQGDADFPHALTEVDDAPVALWATGRVELLNTPKVALIGARNASSLGTRMAAKLAQEVGEAGFTIVSGLARGIDAAAHHKSLPTGTIAVVAGGVDVLYPAENADLARAIAQKGLCLSDQPMGFQPRARHFVARNRIISGLSQAVVVVEAAAKSGSLGTARTALDQGRDVLAVPGHPFDARVAGCNALIRDGAVLVRGPQDILVHLGAQPDLAPELRLTMPAQPPKEPAPAPEPRRSLRETAALHNDILTRLSPAPMAEDQLIRALGTSAHTIAPVLMDLELDGKVVRQAGGVLARTI
ncbi:DNA-processing protein DprA [Pseudooctadecabacter jejudonensis]|uniref:Uncharacterized protein n=1 Tax=Pseudooctadecabacter jejudonensis TaxID=1391910 RepID=A0A1Y5SVJ0_9RHOB|nr:DNA-processing protein DprA [Pseudooctadecabacter jejudonensis]SLN49393.1 hypothetical protein PSJ8397_02555 [Pseudooctadecabacter jejudonensis]